MSQFIIDWYFGVKYDTVKLVLQTQLYFQNLFEFQFM